jgi:hypothetical protein
MFKFIFFIFLFSSCASVVKDNLSDKDIPDLLKALNGEGEGRGRIGLNQNKYSFSFEALLNDQKDWILAVSFPFHGEEVLQFKDISQAYGSSPGQQRFEKRIEMGIRNYLVSHGESAALTQQFMLELRSLIRILMHQRLDLELISQADGQIKLDHIYQAEKKKGYFSIKKLIGNSHEIELRASNLTDSFFKRTDILLYSKKSSKKDDAILSLELYWN